MTPKFRKNRRTTRWNPEGYGNLIDCHQPILPQNLPVHQARVAAKCFCLYLCASLSAVVSTGPYLQVSSNEVVANDLIAKFFVATVFEFELCFIGGSCTGQPVRTQGRSSQKSYEMETLPFWQDRFFRLLWSFRWMQNDANTFELTQRKVGLQSQHAAVFFARKTSSWFGSCPPRRLTRSSAEPIPARLWSNLNMTGIRGIRNSCESCD